MIILINTGRISFSIGIVDATQLLFVLLFDQVDQIWVVLVEIFECIQYLLFFVDVKGLRLVLEFSKDHQFLVGCLFLLFFFSFFS